MPNSLVIADTTNSPHARQRPVPVDAVRLSDSFWRPRIERNRTDTIPSQYQHCITTNRIRNFQRAAGKVDAPFEGIFFNDSDIYKWLEAASWALGTNPDDEELRTMVNDVIKEIGDAQQPDGYLNTYFMFEKAAERWTNVRDMHELYCAGHLFQAAVAHYRATGEESLLNIARRFADNIYQVFGPEGRLSACGHPEAEMALVELYRATGETNYLTLAQRMIDARGGNPKNITGGTWDDRRYLQDHVPFRELDEVTGHAVRMLYLSTGATDAVLERGEPALREALDKQYASFTKRRMYITGGAGSRYEGEAFGRDYELTNDRAYTETCAAIASVMWNYRLLLLTGEAKYADLMEWTLINAVLPGISLDQKEYFYQNPLENDGSHRRKEWFGCACCPPNVARTLAQLTGYFYTLSEEGIFVHLYANGEAHIDGAIITQQTEYPWQDTIRITVSGASAETKTLHLRIPAWAEGATLNGSPVTPGSYTPVPLTGGAAEIHLVLPMPVRRFVSHPYATVDYGLIALARGPIVYCLEQVDHSDSDIRNLRLATDTPLTAEYHADLLGGVTILTGQAISVAQLTDDLYAAPGSYDAPATSAALTAIPYYAWANREAGSMRIWIPTS